MALADSVKSFVWGAGGQRLTPEQITVLRALQARKDKGVDTSPVASWTQGAARIADAIGEVAQDRRLNAQDKLNQQENSTLLHGLLGQMDGTASLPMPTAAGEVSATAPAYSAAPPTASGEIADYIRQSATARGIDPDTALRVALSEGGVNDPVRQSGVVKNGVREQSYGPFQLYLNGGLGNKALQAGIDPRDPNQWKQGVDFALDQAKAGGWGPWYGAKKIGVTGMQGIGQAPIQVASAAPQTATDAIGVQSPIAPQTPYVDTMVTTAYQAPPPPMTAPRNQPQSQVVPELMPDRFANNPALQSVQGARLGQAPNINQAQFDDRFGSPQQFDAASPDMVAASLLGTPSPSPQALAQAIPQQVAPAALAPQVSPQAVPQQVAQAAPPQNNRAIIQALTSPYANEQTRSLATLLFQNQQKQAEAQAEAQRQAQDPYRQLQIQKLQADIAATQNPDANLPEGFRALQLRAKEAGFQPGTPEYQQFFQSQGVRAPNTYATPPVGFRYVNDQAGNPVSLEPIPGSPQALEAERAVQKQTTTNELKDVAANTVVSSIGKAINAINAPGLPATGTAGNLLSSIPETNAAELRRQLASIKSNITLDSLQAARAASPTGAALGAVSDKEGELLANKLGSLDPSSPNFQRDILDVQKTYLQTVYGKDKGDQLFDQSITLRNAQAAIAKGANREAVLKKLQDAGIPTEGLE